MKRIIFLSSLLLILSNQAFAQASDYENEVEPYQPPLPSIHNIQVNVTSENAFYFKPFLSIEYSAPTISGGGANVDFKTSHRLSGQIREFQNFAVGGHFRVQKYLGFNLNWQQTEMDNASLYGVGTLARQANFKMDHYNLSALFFVPIVPNTFELFAELGVADMNSKIDYVQSNGNFVSTRAHETKALFGGGAQVNLNKTSTVRVSFQKYSGNLALIHSNYSTFRIGYLHAF